MFLELLVFRARLPALVQLRRARVTGLTPPLLEREQVRERERERERELEEERVQVQVRA